VLVDRLIVEAGRAVGVRFIQDGKVIEARARGEVILCAGSIGSIQVLQRSGIGPAEWLAPLGIEMVLDRQGVGRNLQDHFGFDCVWEFPDTMRGAAQVGSTLFWDSEMTDAEGPDLFACLGSFPKSTAENIAKFGLPENSWILFGSPTHPKSRGQVRLCGPHPSDPIRIEANALSHPDDLKTAIACVERLREIGNSPELRPFVKREVMPGDLTGSELENFLRNAVTTYWHAAGTAKMGRDPLSVVDGILGVYGTANLRVADASIMPRITSANTMAPCVVIGERAAQFIKAEHHL